MKKDRKGQEVFCITSEDLQKLRKFFKNRPIILAITNLGCNMALRGSDLIKLKFEDIEADNTIRIFEKKTGKCRIIKLNRICLKSIQNLKIFYEQKKISPKGYLFKSLHPFYCKNKIDKHISLSSVDRYYRIARKELSIPYPIGTHSLRKTWGNRVYKKTKNIAVIMKALNHSNVSHTLCYIGITQNEINSIYEKVEI
ncbi:tyrosine-type recombinase/integrase [Fusobacterium necrophorum]|uniref:Site-specific integrase n=1 Tax=Fusobacterium necrophorum TaxID=859 RepID=A0A4Q2KV91_9FUSO|nr:tyrosine-type recombinase/integrase [Fusobacterium necrophorum]RXZ68430.1 site-specific integrase [Fusobacterium necrophorum]